MLKFLPVNNLHLSKGKKVGVDNVKHVLRKVGLVLPDKAYKDLQRFLAVYGAYQGHSFRLGLGA